MGGVQPSCVSNTFGAEFFLVAADDVEGVDEGKQGDDKDNHKVLNVRENDKDNVNQGRNLSDQAEIVKRLEPHHDNEYSFYNTDPDYINIKEEGVDNDKIVEADSYHIYNRPESSEHDCAEVECLLKEDVGVLDRGKEHDKHKYCAQEPCSCDFSIDLLDVNIQSISH